MYLFTLSPCNARNLNLENPIKFLFPYCARCPLKKQYLHPELNVDNHPWKKSAQWNLVTVIPVMCMLFQLDIFPNLKTSLMEKIPYNPISRLVGFIVY